MSGVLSWRRLHSLVMHLPPESASVQATNPDAAWGRTEHILAGIYDLLASANWQRGGKKSAPRPRPLPRPGLKLPGQHKYGTASRSIEEMRIRLDQRNRGGAHVRRHHQGHRERPRDARGRFVSTAGD